MKCSRCECQFAADSAMVVDHKYAQHCIDALKLKVKRLEERDFIAANTLSNGGTISVSAGVTTFTIPPLPPPPTPSNIP